MLNDISRLAGASLAGSRAIAGPEARPPAVAISSAATATPRRVTDPVRAWEQATRIAASAMFAGREVEVTSFHDQGSGRIVCKVADRSSGEVLMQSPPDALLRFFANTRDALAEPLLAVEA